MTEQDLRHTDQVGELYDVISDLFVELWDGNLHFGYWEDADDPATLAQAAERMTDLLVERLDPAPGARVLDVGCGVGSPAVRLARARAVEVVGISVSRHQIDRANERAAAAGLADTVRFEHANAMALPYPDASFDAAWAVESMLHMPDRGQVLREIRRVLRPGGRLVVADMILRAPVPPERRTAVADFCAQSHITEISLLADYRALVAESGFEPLEVTDVSVHSHPTWAVVGAEMHARRDEIVRDIGSAPFEHMVTAPHVGRSIPEFGYALLTAQKPLS